MKMVVFNPEKAGNAKQNYLDFFRDYRVDPTTVFMVDPTYVSRLGEGYFRVLEKKFASLPHYALDKRYFDEVEALKDLKEEDFL